MSWIVGNWEFEGPYENFETLLNSGGLYVLFCGTEETFEVCETGLASDLKTHFEGPSPYGQWIHSCSGRLCLIVLYSQGRSDQEMLEIKDAVERELDLN